MNKRISNAFSRYQLPQKFENALQRNKALANEEILLKGSIRAPESIVVEGDHFYAGSNEGKFYQIYKDGLKIKSLSTGMSPSSRGFGLEMFYTEFQSSWACGGSIRVNLLAWTCKMAFS